MDRIAGIALFVRVVESGSFSKAARDHGVTQPTVTKHVAFLEKKLKARLLNRNTRGVSTTEVGALYYEKCKRVLSEFEEADNLAALLQSQAQGVLRVGSSVAFGRRVIAPLLLEFMAQHPNVRVDLSLEDRYVDLVAQGIDVAVRMGRLADSSLGGRYLGMNPWVMVASRAYLRRRGTPTKATQLGKHDCLTYSTVQGDDVWHLRSPTGEALPVPVRGPLRSNNLQSLLDAAGAGLGIAILPHYVAAPGLVQRSVITIMTDHSLPEQEVHAVYPSPKLVPGKVTAFIQFLQGRFRPGWWLGNAKTARVGR